MVGERKGVGPTEEFVKRMYDASKTLQYKRTDGILLAGREAISRRNIVLGR